MKKNNKFDESMLDFLCCPSCKGDFKYDEKRSFLVCIGCRKEFLVKDGIPILLLE